MFPMSFDVYPNAGFNFDVAGATGATESVVFDENERIPVVIHGSRGVRNDIELLV